jgi:hypothetical protein
MSRIGAALRAGVLAPQPRAQSAAFQVRFIRGVLAADPRRSRRTCVNAPGASALAARIEKIAKPGDTLYTITGGALNYPGGCDKGEER